MAWDIGVEIFVLQRFQVMKDWSDLEERYQDIRAHDPVAADAFKRWMTARFQETVAALEESGAAEKHQLSAMHQQRVQVRGNVILAAYFQSGGTDLTWTLNYESFNKTLIQTLVRCKDFDNIYQVRLLCKHLKNIKQINGDAWHCSPTWHKML